MVSFKDRLRERWIDVCEWVDYRPDADFRWLAAIPFILAGGWLYGSAIGLGLAFAFALFVTTLVAILGCTAIVVWILANTIVDVVYTFRLPSRQVPVRVKVVSDRS